MRKALTLSLGALALFIMAVMTIAPLRAQVVTVKNYMTQCAGANCDNVLVLGGTWKIGTTAVSAVASELNWLAGVTAGTLTASKAVVVDASSQINAWDIKTTFKLNGSTVSSTAAELNFNNTAVAGTAVASKTAVLGANKNLDTLVLPASGLFIGAGAGTAVTPTAAELNVNAGVTGGTAIASKTVVTDANVAVTGLKTALGAATTTSAGTAMGGLVDQTSTASGTTQNTEYTLNTVTIPANAFNANGRALHCVAWGTTTANANAKNLKFYIGGTSAVTVTGSTASGKDYWATLDVARLNSNSQTAVGTIQVDTAVAPTMLANGGVAETDTAGIIIAFKSANTAAAAASATGKGLSCYFVN